MKTCVRLIPLAIAAAVWTVAPLAMASTFKNITINDDYSDWVSVPVLDSDGGDNQGGPDIGDTQIANDNKYLYIHNTFANNLTLSTFLALDVDQNAATGYDIFGLGLIGSEAGWQNDYAFAQATGVYNTFTNLSGDFFGGGHALLSNFSNATNRELAIPLNVLFAADNSAVFPDKTLTLMFWTDLGVGPDGTFGGFNGDVSGVIQYTLAIPEPASAALLGLALVGCVGLRRRK